MAHPRSIFACLVALLSAAVTPALAQKQGGTLKFYFFDSPATMSIHEESTVAGQGPMMGVFNNLVMYDQAIEQSGLKTIVPDLASEWAWDQAGTNLTFKLRSGVKWHDGKPFGARDVKCTWDLLMGKEGPNGESLRVNPRKTWYGNLQEVVVEADDRVTFRLKRPQPAFIALIASGFSPVYPCHVNPAEMRRRPIGTGPFRFVEFKPNEIMKVARNKDYWKKDRPWLDAIEYRVIKNQSTGMLTFVAGDVDVTSPYYFQVPMLNDIKAQVPTAVCQLKASNVQRNVLINREAPPFDNADLRRAVALTVDRKAFIDTLTQGAGSIGGALLAPPEGVWGMPEDIMRKLPGYDPDVAKNREEARKLMAKAGYGPDKRLKIKVTTRNISVYRDPAVILIDQLKQIWIDAELEPIDTTQWYPRVRKRDYAIGMNLTGNGLDEPDQAFYENYVCGSESNWDGYCNPEIDKAIEAQSREPDQEKRKNMVWDIERRLAEDVARPVLYHNRSGTCWHPYVKGFSPMINSIYNGMRMEDVWLDR
ncbi:MAG: ABC transporter substrate-binding protein [Hyphomicrobiaceae bacterium]